MICSDCGKSTNSTYKDGACYLCLKHKQQKEYAEEQEKKTKMQIGEIRALPKSSSPMFTEQWAVQGTAKSPYIVSRKGGYKGTGYATPEQKAEAWQCSCKSWTTTVPRADCKHVVSVKLKEGILKEATPIDWVKKNPFIKIPKADGVVLSKEEHEAYKKFQEARAAMKSGNSFNEEGRRFRP